MNLRESYTLERFDDNDLAVLESQNGSTFPVPRSWLPPGTREGDVLHVSPFFSRHKPDVILLNLEREAQAAEVLEAIESLRLSLPKGPEGDINL